MTSRLHQIRSGGQGRRRLWLPIILTLIFSVPKSSLGGVREVSFIYKPRFVTADFILKYAKDHPKTLLGPSLPSGWKLHPEGGQDFILFRFGGGIARFHPAQRGTIQLLRSKIDTPENGMHLLGYDSLDSFQQKNGLPQTFFMNAETERKLMELLGKDKPANKFALSSNELANINQRRVVSSSRKQYPYRSTGFYGNYAFHEYLGCANLSSGAGFDSETMFFKNADGMQYVEFSSFDNPFKYWVWTSPVEGKVSIDTQDSDVLVLPKYLGSNGERDLFALIDAPSLETKEDLYKRLEVVYLQDRDTAIAQIVKGMASVWEKNDQLISPGRVGRFHVGQPIPEARKLHPERFETRVGRQNYRDGIKPTLYVRPKNQTYQEVLRADYDDKETIRCIRILGPQYTTKTGLRVSSIAHDFYIQHPGLRKEWSTAQPTVDKVVELKTALYPTLTFVFEAGKKGFSEESELIQIIVGDTARSIPIQGDVHIGPVEMSSFKELFPSKSSDTASIRGTVISLDEQNTTLTLLDPAGKRHHFRVTSTTEIWRFGDVGKKIPLKGLALGESITIEYRNGPDTSDAVKITAQGRSR